MISTNIVRNSRVSLFIPLLFMVTVVGCSGSDQNPVESTTVADLDQATAASFVEPPATVAGTLEPQTAEQTSSAGKDRVSARPNLQVLDVDALVINPCIVSPELGTGAGLGEGTAPAPAPTPAPRGLSRPRHLVTPEVERFWSRHSPIISNILIINEAFEHAWTYDLSTQEQAGQIQVLGSVMSQMCSSIAIEPVPIELLAQVVAFADSVRARNAWAALAAERITCCADAQTEFMDVGRINTYKTIKSQAGMLESTVTNYLSEYSAESRSPLVSERMSINIQLGDNHIVVRNSVDIFISTPSESEYLVADHLGLQSWDSGQGIRVRRVRNREDLTIEESVNNLIGLISKWGDPKRVSDIGIEEFTEATFEYPVQEDGWRGGATLFIHDGHSFIVETMCLTDNNLVCEEQREVVRSISPLESPG